ncbi:MAG: ketosteroid isomerase [Lacunisphaera sp.]|nr:ketosteroid isomerase [Lacunisphaera sp.]
MREAADKQQIRQKIKTWMRASFAGQIDQVLPLMANDVVFLRGGHPPMRGRKAFAKATSGAMQQAKISGKANIREITIAGKYAFVWNHLVITFTPAKGKAQRHAGDVLSVFRKERSGRWVLWRDANLLGG